MKNRSLISPILVSFLMVVLIGCQTPVEEAKDKLQEAKDEVVTSKQELKVAIEDSLQLYRDYTLKKIAANEKRIAEMKEVAKMKTEYKAKYEKVMIGLEQKNKEMKTKLNNYKDEGAEMWMSFRSELDYDMDELEQAINNLFEDNEQ